MGKLQSVSYPAIDVCKLTMAILVVAIHIEAIYHLQFNGIMHYVTRTAVPFFFIASGFLLNGRMKASDDDAVGVMRQYIGRIFKLYMFWTAVYAPIAVYMNFHSGINCVQGFIQYAKGVLLVGESYYSWHLWYLLALLIALLAIGLMRRMHLSIVHIFIVGLMLMCVGQAMDRVYADGVSNSVISSVLHKYYGIFQNTRNGIFQGIGFVSAGMWIREKFPPPIIVKKRIISISAFFVLSLVLFHFDIILWRVLSGMTMLVVGLSISLPQKTYYINFRKLSTLIYFSHMYFLFVMSRWLVKDEISVMEMALFLCCLILCNMLVLRLIRSGRMKWLNQFV